jgi:predicted ArsR family transcriptional regulator
VTKESDFSRLGKLGAALGDATRFSIFRFVVESPRPVSAGETADRFGLHRTVARSHLEKLTEAGLLSVATRRNAGGGRPAKVYSPSPGRLEIQLPPRRYEALSAMLLRMVAHMNGTAASLARDVGFDFGRDVAATLPPHDGARPHPDLAAIIEYLEANGYQPALVDADPRRVVIDVGNCAFREIAESAPEVVCGLSSGLLCGLFDVPLERHTHALSILRGDATCRHEFRL